MKPSADDPNKTKFTWLLNLDLKVRACTSTSHYTATTAQFNTNRMFKELETGTECFREYVELMQHSVWNADSEEEPKSSSCLTKQAPSLLYNSRTSGFCIQVLWFLNFEKDPGLVLEISWNSTEGSCVFQVH